MISSALLREGEQDLHWHAEMQMDLQKQHEYKDTKKWKIWDFFF